MLAERPSRINGVPLREPSGQAPLPTGLPAFSQPEMPSGMMNTFE
jgi:hypothetical protein